MRKILLTSSGFDTKALEDVFLRLVGKPAKAMHVLFIPTAAIDPGAIEVLPKCMNDLLRVGVAPRHIRVFDLHRSLTAGEMDEYDAVYLTGGSPAYLLERINATGFHAVLADWVERGGVYVGVSAGSCVAAGNLADNLGYLRAELAVHTKTGTASGAFDNASTGKMKLKNGSAVLIQGDQYEVIP
ncbi:MAG: Type 1 glutamine amidotransferase-like domain-containing protein [Oscillospiraceae bacterium]|jgi:peptidase E|nr:Type 1 glutamine amidotransferase-like domain-containing protein [Oscillospiraceae bacterium]